MLRVWKMDEDCLVQKKKHLNKPLLCGLAYMSEG